MPATAMSNTMAGPGLFGVPVRGWVAGLVGDESGGTSPKGLSPDRLAGYIVNPAGQFSPGVARGVASSPTVLPSTLMNLYVRKTGSDNNGGSSVSATPDQTGTDGVTNGTTTFTAVSGAFTAADVNKLINIVTKGRYRITAVGGLTSVTLSGSPTAGSGLTWNLGGSVLTIGALLANTTAALLGGDRVWIGAGVYREVVTVQVTPTFELQIVGDTDGAMTGDAGLVEWTAYLTTDLVAASGSPCVTLNAKSNLTFKNIFFQGGSGASGRCIQADTGGATNISIINCSFIAMGGDNRQVSHGTLAGLPSNWLIDRCRFLSTTRNVATQGIIALTLVRHNQDYDTQIVIRNSVLIGSGDCISIAATGALGANAGGVLISDCTFSNGLRAVGVGASISTSIPTRITGCIVFCDLGLNANTAGQIIESYNMFHSVTPRTNIAAGVGSNTVAAAKFSIGQEAAAGMALRHPFEPMATSPMLGFGGVRLGTDLRGNPRPAGNVTPAAGALERANTVAQAVSPAPPSGTHVWQQTGPGYQDFLVPVTTSATTIAVSVQRDSAYTGPMPGVELLANGQVGVTAQVVPMSGPDSAWETLTLAAFTPAAAGVVAVRIRSQDTSGGSLVSFANFTIT